MWKIRMTTMLLISILLCSVLTACGSKGEIKETVKDYPEIQGVDFNGNNVTNDIFKDNNVTVVTYWSNT